MDATLPIHATLKDISATYNQDTISRALQTEEKLPVELWAQVVVADGEVDLKMSGKTARLTPGTSAVIPPETPFTFVPTGKPVRFYLNYFHEPLLADGKSLASQLGRRVA